MMLSYLRRQVIAAAPAASRALVERYGLTRVPGALAFSRFIFGARLRMLAPLIDREFYLRQLSAPARGVAARDPALHYILSGWMGQLAPNPDFDPVFYRATNADLSWASDPLEHFARRGGAGPTNEVAALPRVPQARTVPRRGGVVTLHHGRGGGSSRYLALLEDALHGQGHDVVRLARVSPVVPLFRPVDVATATPAGAVFHLFEEEDAIVAFLRGCGTERLVINHVIDLPPEIFSWIARVAKRAAIPFDVVLHDYFLVCPRVNLIDGSGLYCGEPPLTVCQTCVRANGSDAGPVDVVDWRAHANALLRAAGRIIVPSGDAVDRIRRHWPGLAVDVWEPETAPTPLPRARPLVGGEPLRIAILGGLNVAKGYNVVLSLARLIQERRLPLQLTLIGPSADDDRLLRAGVTMTGRYRESDLDALIRRHDPHVVFLPAVWPETWSFVLTVALTHALPVFAFDIGAIAQRLRRLGHGTLMPFDWATRIDPVADAFLGARAEAARCEV